MNQLLKLLFVISITAFFTVSSSTAFSAKPNENPPIGPYGIGTTPAVYLINFLLIYIGSPDAAANMPAYRAPIPLDVAECLINNPEDSDQCTIFEYANSFDGKLLSGSDNQYKKCALPEQCRAAPQFEAVAPPVAQHPDQLNEPLGLDRAHAMAEAMLIDKSMVLTDTEWECTLGEKGERDLTQEIVNVCLANLTNSTGNTNIPLSSYGLAVNHAGDVQSLCAPQAPCLEFNKLFFGPLENLAFQCGWLEKLHKMRTESHWKDVIGPAGNCQDEIGGSKDGGACLAAPVCG